MLQISLNTAIEPYGISLLDDEKHLSSFNWSFSDTGRNEHILGIDFLLKNSNKKIQDINFITIISGPGSFTGLRIGFTFSKTLNYIFKIPVVTVNSFEVIKESIKIDNYIIVINAQLKEFFVFNGGKIEIKKENEVKEILKEKILITPEYYLLSKFDKGIYIKIDTQILGKIGLEKFKKGEINTYKNLNPLYLREAEAIFKKFK